MRYIALFNYNYSVMTPLKCTLLLPFLRKAFAFSFLFLLLLPQHVEAQLDVIHYFPPIHSRQNSQIAEQYIYLSTPEPTPFVVTLEDGGGNFIGSVIIAKDAPQNFFVGSGQFPGTDVAVPRDSVAKVLEASGVIASAPFPFYCNVRVKAPFQATSVACKGSAALGKDFYAGSMPQVVSNSNRNFVTSIMATEDGTLVNVTGYNPGVVFESPAVPRYWCRCIIDIFRCRRNVCTNGIYDNYNSKYDWVYWCAYYIQ